MMMSRAAWSAMVDHSGPELAISFRKLRTAPDGSKGASSMIRAIARSSITAACPDPAAFCRTIRSLLQPPKKVVISLQARDFI